MAAWIKVNGMEVHCSREVLAYVLCNPLQLQLGP